MRICLYTETALPKTGGQENVVDVLARQFQSLGHEPVVLAPHPRPPLRVNDCDLPYPVFRHPRFVSTRYLVRWYKLWLKRAYRKFPFDVLHCHSVYPTAFLASLIRDYIPTPVVVTSHGGDVAATSRRLQKPVLVDRHLKGIQTADKIIAISEFCEKRLQQLGANLAQIQRIPNGVDYEEFAKRAARPSELDQGIEPGEYVFFIGRLVKRKGVDILLRALSLTPQNGRLQLVIAGSGAERQNLEELASRLGVAERVRFLGPVFGDTKRYLLQNARCTVVPSRGWEAFGLVVLESFASGTPVAATSLAGMRDLIDTEKTGWLVSEESPQELADVLTNLFAENSDWRKRGARAQRAAKTYDWRIIAKRHIDLFRECCAEKNSTPLAS